MRVAFESINFLMTSSDAWLKIASMKIISSALDPTRHFNACSLTAARATAAGTVESSAFRLIRASFSSAVNSTTGSGSGSGSGSAAGCGSGSIGFNSVSIVGKGGKARFDTDPTPDPGVSNGAPAEPDEIESEALSAALV